MKTHTHDIRKGFTIIETLVAITVLMIAVAGPLVVAGHGLFGARIAKDQMIASYLGQESMEAVKNIRDNNVYNGSNWLTSLSGCTLSAPCDASALDGSGQNPSLATCSGGPCQIYSEANGYGHTPGGGAQATIFTRRFYMHDPTGTGACASADECGATVEVYWNEGSIPYSVTFTSEITSTIR